MRSLLLLVQYRTRTTCCWYTIYSTRINSDRALLGGGSMSGTRTVPYGREDRRLLHVSFSQDVLPKPIYQLILSEDYNNRIIPFF